LASPQRKAGGKWEQQPLQGVEKSCHVSID
jgi:hypothetical protein